MSHPPSSPPRPHRAWTLSALPLALWLGACGAPSDIAPIGRLHEAARLGLSATATPSVAERWWAQLGDARLTSLVDQALRDHPSLSAAQARMQRAGAALSRSQASDQPVLDIGFDGTRQRFSGNGIYPAPLGGNYWDTDTLQVAGKWEFDLFGKHRADIAAALGEQDAAAVDVQAARVLIASSVVRAYVQWARLGDLRQVLSQLQAQRERWLSLVQQRHAAGLDTRVEVRQGESGTLDVREQIAALDEQTQIAQHALAALVGVGTQVPGAAPSLSALRLDAPAASELGIDLLGRRADVQAARLRVEASTQALASARAAFYPNVSLIGFAGMTSLGLNRLLKNGSEQFGVGPSIHLPLFDGGLLKANARARSSDVDLAIATYNQAVLEAVRDAADQLSSSQALTQQLALHQRAVAAAQSSLDLAQQRAQAGLTGELPVIAARSAWLAQQRLSVELNARALDNRVALIRALGGGFTAPAQVQARPQPQPVSHTPAPADTSAAPTPSLAAPTRG